METNDTNNNNEEVPAPVLAVPAILAPPTTLAPTLVVVSQQASNTEDITKTKQVLESPATEQDSSIDVVVGPTTPAGVDSGGSEAGYFFNNQKFSDCRLVIIKGATLEIIWVSKVLLASSSEFFSKLFTNGMIETGSSTITLHLPDDVEIEHLKDVIRCVYKEPIVTPLEDILHILYLSDRYGVECAIRRMVKKLKLQEINMTNASIFLDMPENIKRYPFVKESLVDPAVTFIQSYFGIVREIFSRQLEEFLALPLEIVLVIVKSDILQVDSENSVFYLVYLWISHSHVNRSRHLSTLLPHIRFPHMRIHFLLDLIPHVATSIFPECSDFLLRQYHTALEFLHSEPRRITRIHGLPKNTSDVPPEAPPDVKRFFPRTFIPQNSLHNFRYEFKHLSQWDLVTPLRSETVHSNGYEFFFVLQTEQHVIIIDENNMMEQRYVLEGFLRCTSRVLPENFFLPLRVNIRIPMNNSVNDKNFAHQLVILKNSQVGGVIVEKENRRDLIGAEFLNPDSILIEVTVNYLDTDEDCEVEL